ncbi:conserved hypothetical protein [Candidatus Protochlamydia naegleriophila]|uniref:DUF5681 domain-containing protein n=1 Tax=Candidatus Protochlamydia naegleriophila TaxID=389348 RepID=A0A0U5EV40_9BACT|nr:DUF5681 domain-containing protein [Candidatus Protochlamydia naegleriophila]CUI18033.1 conserved hypothetical protein [Candidatus Protochlamydia naegleriophila]
MPENAGQMQVPGKFRKGQSGNPQGKAKGTKNRATLAAERLLNGDLDNICRKLIDEALTGNVQAIKLVLDRVLPAKRDRDIDVRLPKLQTVDDAVNAMSLIIESVSCGSISPSEGEAMSRVVDAFVKAIQAYDVEKRVLKLEQEVKK